MRSILCEDAPPAKRRRLNSETQLQHQQPAQLSSVFSSDSYGRNADGRVSDGQVECVVDETGNSVDKFSLCCFGMLEHGRIDFKILCQVSCQVLTDLSSVSEIQTQAYCYLQVQSTLRETIQQSSRNRRKPLRSWLLNVIIYGKEGIEGKVGEYISKHKMYLQDPLDCEKSLPYRNPHMLPLETGEIVMTDIFNSTNLEIERLGVKLDLLSQLMEDITPLKETEPSNIVRTVLFPHQKQALTFMLKREKGWDLENNNDDIWSRRRDSLGRFRYINNISGFSSNEPPPDFQGGLLADDMGLGKSLSMISLIASNQACVAHLSNSNVLSLVKTTLLIVPPALIQSWKQQFDLHLHPGKLKCLIYHGQSIKNTETLSKYDVVITTYHTLSAIWKRDGKQGNKKSIFTFSFHRVVLDEAHTIQNYQSQLAQACCALQSKKRWAITGTPIQNKLTNFSSIVKFLQVYPYADRKIFDNEIIKPWHSSQGTNAQGFLRLKALVRAITISRTKNIVSLPARIDEIHHLEFTFAERQKYDVAKSQSQTLLQEAIHSGNQKYSDILGQSTSTSYSFEPCFSEQVAPYVGDATCSICGNDLLDDLLQGTSLTDIEGQVIAYERTTCEQCSSQIYLDVPQGHRLSPERSSKDSRSVTPARNSDAASCIEHMSTKIKALIADLSKHHKNQKSVVFSFWTSTLDFVQLMLNECGIKFTRIDGKTSFVKRTEAVHAFQHNDDIRVILVSITCGGAGIDLTAGSRAYLLEPHWNPMIEEQALSRIHRVGQKREITTIRYLMRDSFEEQIVDTQKRKKVLAQVTFSQDSPGNVSLGMLQYLKSALE